MPKLIEDLRSFANATKIVVF